MEKSKICEVCSQGLCQHGDKCCRCNDYDYIIACTYCSRVYDDLREPDLSPETEAAMKASMDNAALLRTHGQSVNTQLQIARKSIPIKRSSQRSVPPIEIPQLSPEFVFLWSQNSPTSPGISMRKQNSGRSSERSNSGRSSERSNSERSNYMDNSNSDAEVESSASE